MILLLNPPNPDNSVSNKDMMAGFGQLYPQGAREKIPPIDMAYAAALLRQVNMDVFVIDCLGSDWDLDALLVNLSDVKPSMVAIRTSTPTVEWDLFVAQQVKITTGSKILMYGPHVMLHPDDVLSRECVDVIIVSEAEAVFSQFREPVQLENYEGIWYKGDNGVIRNKPRPVCHDLDRLPFPAWDMLPYGSYDATRLMRHIKPVITVLASRGCPHGCMYCPYPVVQGRKRRVRSPENVVNELVWLSTQLGVKAVLFRDPEFSLDRTWTVVFCNILIHKKLALSWRCETRLENLDASLLSLMASSGCIGINLGIESADKRVLRSINRVPVSLWSAKHIINCCSKHGIDTFCFFIIGLPDETRLSAIKTILSALWLNPDFAQFSVATPYPGTELQRFAEGSGFREQGDLSALTGYHATLRTKYLSIHEVDTLHRYANFLWTVRASGIAKNLMQFIGLLFTKKA